MPISPSINHSAPKSACSNFLRNKWCMQPYGLVQSLFCISKSINPHSVHHSTMQPLNLHAPFSQGTNGVCNFKGLCNQASEMAIWNQKPQYWQLHACRLPQEKLCCGRLHRSLLRLYRPQSAVSCSTLWERAAWSSPNTSQVSLSCQPPKNLDQLFKFFRWSAFSDPGGGGPTKSTLLKKFGVQIQHFWAFWCITAFTS